MTKQQPGAAVRTALESLWRVVDFPCGQRLAPLGRTELERLRRMKELDISEPTAEKRARISPATIDRLLRPKKEEIKDGRRYASRGTSLIAKKIPLRMTDWETARVGAVELDLVLHCGAATDGEYGHSLSLMEICSGWRVGEVVRARGRVRLFTPL